MIHAHPQFPEIQVGTAAEFFAAIGCEADWPTGDGVLLYKFAGEERYRLAESSSVEAALDEAATVFLSIRLA